ncbi:MAG: hypothetical protein ACYDEQ_10825, partial [Desulfocucumaceae bacterium]
VRYSADRGTFVTWDAPVGKVSIGASTVEMPYGIPVYWSPIDLKGQALDRDSLINVVLLDETGNKIDDKKLTIIYDGSFFYSVRPSPDIYFGSEALLQTQKLKDLNKAVGRSIKS